MNQSLIEQIVTNVLAQLQPQPAVAPRAEVADAGSPVAPASTVITLDHPIITAEVLHERLRGAQTLRIGARSILTPTARDWLRERNVRWQRVGRASISAAVTSRRQLLIGTVTPAARNVRETLSDWKVELLGRPGELAEASIRAVTSGEADFVVAVSDAADVVACRANRNERVRAAVVTSSEHLQLLVEYLGPNVLVVNPRGRSFVELRHLLRAIAALPAPHSPKNWD